MLFGICALFFVGMSWSLVGVVMGRAAKEGIDTGLVQLFGACVSGAVAVIVYLTSRAVMPSDCEPKYILLGCGAYFLASIMNFCGLQAMSAGMKRGPNGIVFCIMQSAVLFTFSFGILFHDEALTFYRGAGIVLMLAALILYGFARDNSQQVTGNWRAFAFLALGLIIIQQNLHNEPSFHEQTRNVPRALRIFAGCAGTLVAFSTRWIWHYFRDRAQAVQMFSGLKDKRLYIYVGCLQFFGLIFAYLLHYPGLDAMAKAGAGSVSYPLMVGSCLASFTAYSAIVLKERGGLVQACALACCLLGLTGLCIPA